MEILSTPETRFTDLPDYPFAPHYYEVAEGLNMHYLDEGQNEEEVILLLHGEPSWSYLYRTMIPPLVAAGYRIIAPDLIGFGKSDKPAVPEDYSYAAHLEWLEQLVITGLDLQHITLFCQDWGGLLGLRIAMAHQDRFKRIITANTMLPTGDFPVPAAFAQWVEFSQSVPVFPAAGVVNMGTVSTLSEEVKAAYDAPYPDESYKAGARMFPKLVPVQPDAPQAAENRIAWQQLRQWEKPFLTLFSDQDPIMKGGDQVFQKLVPGCKGQAHHTIIDAGHFLQEDKGEELAQHTIAFIQNT